MFLISSAGVLIRFLQVGLFRINRLVMSYFLSSECPLFNGTRFRGFKDAIFQCSFLQARLQRRRCFLGNQLANRRRDRAIRASARAQDEERAVFRYASRILVSSRHFVVSLFTRLRLIFRAFRLISQVIRLEVYIARLFAICRRLRAFYRFEIIAVLLNGEERLSQMVHSRYELCVDTFTRLARSLVSRFAFARHVVSFRIRFLTGFTGLLFVRSYRVMANILFSNSRRDSALVKHFRVSSIITCFCFNDAICIRASLFSRFFDGFRRPIMIFMNCVCLRANRF